MDRQAAIGVFDSGLGGLSILQEIQRQLPDERLIYVADSGHAPYGGKSPQEIVERSQRLSDFLLTQNVKALVVACNTATVHAASDLREVLEIPVVGVEPAIKPAVTLSRNQVIAVWATQATAQSSRLQHLIDTHARQARVVVQTCPGLVEHVEQGDFDSPALKALLQKYLYAPQQAGADTLVLGCTHYPFLLPAIRELSQDRLLLLETSTPVTRQLIRLLDEQDLRCTASDEARFQTASQTAPQTAHRSAKHPVRFFTSAQDDAHRRSLQALWPFDLHVQSLPASYLS